LTRLAETGKKRTKRISKMRMARNLILTIHSQAYTTSNWRRRNRRKVSGKREETEKSHTENLQDLPQDFPHI